MTIGDESYFELHGRNGSADYVLKMGLSRCEEGIFYQVEIRNGDEVKLQRSAEIGGTAGLCQFVDLGRAMMRAAAVGTALLASTPEAGPKEDRAWFAECEGFEVMLRVIPTVRGQRVYLSLYLPVKVRQPGAYRRDFELWVDAGEVQRVGQGLVSTAMVWLEEDGCPSVASDSTFAADEQLMAAILAALPPKETAERDEGRVEEISTSRKVHRLTLEGIEGGDNYRFEMVLYNDPEDYSCDLKLEQNGNVVLDRKDRFLSTIDGIHPLKTIGRYLVGVGEVAKMTFEEAGRATATLYEWCDTLFVMLRILPSDQDQGRVRVRLIFPTVMSKPGSYVRIFELLVRPEDAIEQGKSLADVAAEWLLEDVPR